MLGETYTEYNADWPGETDVVTLGLRCFEGGDGSYFVVEIGVSTHGWIYNVDHVKCHWKAFKGCNQSSLTQLASHDAMCPNEIRTFCDTYLA